MHPDRGKEIVNAFARVTDEEAESLEVRIAHIERALDGGWRIERRVVEGDSVAEVLSYVQYNKEDLISRLRRSVEASLREKRITMAESGRFMKRYEEALEGYTY